MTTTKTTTEIDDAIAAEGDAIRLLVAHLSDLHLRLPGKAYPKAPAGWLDAPDRELRTALAELGALARRPDLLVLTGDLTETDEPEEYAVLAEILRSGEIPTLVVPGNHDRVVREGLPDGRFREGYDLLSGPGWPPHPEGPDFVFRHRVGGWEAVGIDTSRYHHMSEAQRGEISRILADEGAGPCFVLTHSPFLPVGNWVDGEAFHDRRFMEGFIRHRRVRAVFSGHLHMARAWRYRRAVHLTAPSVAFGIGHGIGYLLVGLGEDAVHRAWERLIPGTLRDWYHRDPRPQAASISPLEPTLFESHPFCNPHIWPWRADWRERD